MFSADLQVWPRLPSAGHFPPVDPVLDALPGGDHRNAAGVIMVDPGFPRNVSLPFHGLATKIIDEFEGLLGGIVFKMSIDYNFNCHARLPCWFEL